MGRTSEDTRSNVIALITNFSCEVKAPLGVSRAPVSRVRAQADLRVQKSRGGGRPS